ncbi:MAG: insulinase family protein [Clostridia bacterium]|nr:insulinase family protein [Clostridia bacterium]
MNKKNYDKIGETVYTETAACGLRTVIIPKKGFTKTYALLCTDFGSIDRHFKVSGKEVTIPDGVAHFLEHKMFEQEDGGNAFDKFAVYGANANAFTNFDMTAYLFSTSQNYEECLSHLLSYVSHPYYTDENVEKEQGIIGQEIKMYDDSPDWRVFFGMLEDMYCEHPINIDIAGTCEEIAKITKETLYTCYKSYYHPRNMLLCVVGNADPQTVMEIVDKEIPETPFEKATTILPHEPETVSREYSELYMDVANPLFMIGFKETPCEDVTAALAKYSVLCELVFGKSSKLYNELYDEGLIFGMGADYSIGKQYALVEISGEGKNPKEVYGRVLARIKEIKENGFDREELEIIKRALYGKFVKSLNDTDAMAVAFASDYLLGGDYLQRGGRILEVTYEDIMDILQKGLKHSVLSAVYPNGENK